MKSNAFILLITGETLRWSQKEASAKVARQVDGVALRLDLRDDIMDILSTSAIRDGRPGFPRDIAG
jgi:hypothetical protein